MRNVLEDLSARSSKHCDFCWLLHVVEEVALAHKIEICGGKVELKDELHRMTISSTTYSSQKAKVHIPWEVYGILYWEKYLHRLKRTHNREHAM